MAAMVATGAAAGMALLEVLVPLVATVVMAVWGQTVESLHKAVLA